MIEKMNEHLLNFFDAWWEWYEDGCEEDNPYDFTSEWGLCSNLGEYVLLAGITEEEKTLVWECFYELLAYYGLDDTYPFNEGGEDDYTKERDKTKNELRTSFVFMHKRVKKNNP